MNYKDAIPALVDHAYRRHFDKEVPARAEALEREIEQLVAIAEVWVEVQFSKRRNPRKWRREPLQN